MIDQLRRELIKLDAPQMIDFINSNYAGRAVFSTSFGIEDQVLIHLLATQKSNVDIFTLETGRLFSETYYVWNRTLERYGLPINTYFPNTKDVEQLVSEKGPSSFYESVENRKECCFIRKIEPLRRAISGYDIWITGIRADQSANREEMDFIEWDSQNNIVKIHPLFYWTLTDVEQFLQDNHIPYNPLHDKGFPSIGCQPCTRAVQLGESFRAGRWWWEDQSKRECGLHKTSSK